MVLQHCSHGFLPMNMESTAKIPGKLWHEDPDKLSKSGIAVNEGQVIVRTGDLVVGVLDKNQVTENIFIKKNTKKGNFFNKERSTFLLKKEIHIQISFFGIFFLNFFFSLELRLMVSFTPPMR